MGLLSTVKPNDWVGVKKNFQLISSLFDYDSTQTFEGLYLTDLTATRLIQSNASKELTSVSDLTTWISGTTNQINVTDDGDGTLTLSTPQDIHIGASPTFAGLTITDCSVFAANSILFRPTVNSTTFFRIQEADNGSKVIFTADTTNKKIDFGAKVTAGSFSSPVDVTSVTQYGFELHYSGNNYSAIGLRSRASLITTDTTATAQGGLFQAANTDGINVGVLNGCLIEAIGKSDTTAATISTMRGCLVNTEWNAKDTVTDLRVLHVRTHTRNNATEGYFSNSGYGIYIENEAVGGNGQALNAGIYFKNTNLSGGNSAFTYGIDFTGGTYGTAEMLIGNATIASSSNDIIFQPLTDSATFFQVLDTDGGNQVFGVDVLNERVCIGNSSGDYRLSVFSDDGSDQIGIYHNNTHPFIKWTDGRLTFMTDEGTNTDTYLQIKGKGTGYGKLEIYNEDNLESWYLTCQSGLAILQLTGTSPARVALQPNAAVPIRCFEDATEGETQEFQITGYATGDSKRRLEIGCGTDAADTASFDGLSSYLFDGTINVKGFIGNLVTKTANYTATSDDYTIICNATSASFIITLPAVASHTGRIYNIKKIDSSTNTVTIDGNDSETIDDSTTAILTTQYECITVQSNGSEWWII